MFWDPNISAANERVTYHVQFYQLIEFNDTDQDGTYTSGGDLVIAPILAMAAIDWDFSGFITEEEDSVVTAVHFNFTLAAVQVAGYDDLYVQLRCHVNTTHPDMMKFDIVIQGWPWTHNESYLALRWDLMVQAPGTLTYQHAHQYHYENHTYTFDGAYFTYRNSANAGNDTVPVASSFEDKPERTQVYLVYQNFGNDLLVHDPEVGLSPTTPILDLLPLLLVVGAGALACVVLAAAIWVIRRR
jgi:hypothetical protein